MLQKSLTYLQTKLNTAGKLFLRKATTASEGGTQKSQAKSQPVEKLAGQTTNQPAKQMAAQTTNQPVEKLASQPINQPVEKLAGQTTNQPVNSKRQYYLKGDHHTALLPICMPAASERAAKPLPLENVDSLSAVIQIPKNQIDSTKNNIALSYDFTKMPEPNEVSSRVLKIGNAHLKYREMLIKAQQLAQQNRWQEASNYYETIKAQKIPDALRLMIEKNLNDIYLYTEKELKN